MSGLEAIGIVAGIMQLTKYSRNIQLYIEDVIKKVQDGPDHIDKISNQVESIITLAKKITSYSNNNSELSLEIELCIKRSTALQHLLDRARFAVKDGKTNRLGKIKMAIAWKSIEREIEEAWQQVGGSITVLSLHLNYQNIKLVENIDNKLFRAQALDETQIWIPPKARDRILLLPHRNRQFLGRVQSMRDLSQKLTLMNGHNRIALMGLGGIGKSQLAIEYAHQLAEKEKDTSILFLSAGSELEFERSYCNVATLMGIPTDGCSVEAVCEAIRHQFEMQSSRWLIIVDGIDDTTTLFGAKSLYSYLPEFPTCSVIFTTRNKKLALKLLSSFSLEHLLQLNGLDQDEAVELLKTQSGDLGAEREHCIELATLLDCLPLALAQAASWVAANTSNIHTYLDLYCENNDAKMVLLNSCEMDERTVHEPVLKTWLISFQSIEKESTLAAQILCFAACLHHRKIPIKLLPKPQSLIELAKALGWLQAYSMISKDVVEQTIDMHSLVHLATKHWIRSTQQLGDHPKLAFEAVSQAFPFVLFETKEELAEGSRYNLHAQAVLQGEFLAPVSPEHVQLASRVALYLRVRGSYTDASMYADLSLQWSQALFGENDNRTLGAQTERGVIDQCLGRYQESEKISEAVLEKRKQILGIAHRDSLTTMNSLALALHGQGKYQQAERLHRQALALKQETLGPKDKETWKTLDNLGLTLKRQGRYQETEFIFRQVLSEKQEILGPFHISTLCSTNNLAGVLYRQKKYSEALEIYSELFSARESVLGPTHANTLQTKGNIGLILLKQGKHQEAEEMIGTVLSSYIKLFGDTHPETLRVRSNLALVLEHRKEYVKAERLCRQVFEARRVKLGENHPSTVESLEQANRSLKLQYAKLPQSFSKEELD